jgi:hypothetical protein
VQRTSSSGVGSDYETCAERDVGDVSVWLMSGEVRVNEERSCRVSGVLNRAPRAGKKKKREIQASMHGTRLLPEHRVEAMRCCDPG